MKSKIWKIFAVAMAAAMIACVGAGCAQNGNKNEGSKASVASTASTEGSKTESKDESKTESKDESKTESKDESKTESKDESKTESKEESAEAGELTAEAVAGSYEFSAGSVYHGVILAEDGTLAYRNVNGFTVSGTWEIAEGKVVLHIMGGSDAYDFVDGKLVDSESTEYLPVETLSLEDKTEEVVTKAATAGSWVASSEEGTVVFALNPDGTGVIRVAQAGGEAAEYAATWTVSGGVLAVSSEIMDETLSFGITADQSVTFVSADGSHAYKMAEAAVTDAGDADAGDADASEADASEADAEE